MQVLALIYTAPENEPSPGSPEFGAMMAGYSAFTAHLRQNGAFLAGEALQGVETARSLRLRGGEERVTPGPFAQTHEHLSGYYLIEVPDMETAQRYAAMIPSAAYGTIELRPVMTF